MAEPAPSRPLAGPRNNGADLNDERLGELRRLLVGPEITQLARLQKRLEDPDQRVQDLAQILPAARIRKILEQLIRAIVKYDRDMVADVVGQILPGAVKNAVTNALREFTDNLNEIAEKSVSLRALGWRFEALRTGKPFSTIVLSRSALYSVREVFLIHSKTGVLLLQVARAAAVTKDSDSISSMFTAFQDFVHDSFIGTENKEIETIELGSFKFVIQHGTRVMVAGAVDGAPPSALKGVFRRALEEIEKDLADDLASFQGDVGPFESVRPILERCLLGAAGPKPRRSVVPWLIVGLVVAGLAAWGILGLVHRHQWNTYLDRLRAEPGIVLTNAEKQGSTYVVYGLQDQGARDPAALLAGSGIDASQVKFEMAPYQSLDLRFVAGRDFDRDKSEIEGSLIRFPQRMSDLGAAELDGIDRIAARIRSLSKDADLTHRAVRIELTGHTDEMGTDDMNVHLSQDRANQAAAALVAAGVDRGLLTTRGVATREPVRKGSSDRDRSFNRSVSFRVEANP
jgi:outer membrane protein OmpA-like peptidoglycan-associated protein